MKNENKRAKLSALLIVCLLASSMPLLVFAEEHQETGKHSDTQLATASNADKDEDEDEADYDEIELLDDRKETTKASDAQLASASNADRNDKDGLLADDEEAEEELEIDVELATASNAQEIATADTKLETATADLAAQLIGTWSVDDITFLEFDENQSGSLILPDTDYKFHYTLKGDQLALDFADSHVSDVTYTVSAAGDDLQLVGGKAGTILLSLCDTTLP